MDDLKFNEFEHISEKQYLEKINQELKDKSLDSIIEQNAVDSIQYSPISMIGDKKIPEHFQIPTSSLEEIQTHVNLGEFWKEHKDIVEQTGKLVDSISIDVSRPEDIQAFQQTSQHTFKSVVIRPTFDLEKWLQEDLHTQLPNTVALSWICADPILYGYNSTNSVYTAPDEKEIIHYLKSLHHHPNYKGINVQSCNLKDAGATVIQEIAYTLNLINEYFVMADNQGVSAEILQDNLVISMAHHTDYFLEMAKYRAIRILFQTLAKSHLKSSENQPIIHGRDSYLKLGRKDADLNLLRHTTGAMSAIIGGVDVVECLFHTYEKEGVMDASRLAANTLLLLKHESDLGNVKDPALGSRLIDGLTFSLAEKAWEEFKRIEKNGGFMTCMSNGIIPSEIEKSANRKTRDFNNGEIKMVGTNIFASADKSPVAHFKMNDTRGFKPMMFES